MMNKHVIALTLSLMFACSSMEAEVGDFLSSGWLSDVTYMGRFGYGLGGSAPIGMPATIRHLNKFPLTPNLQVGLDAQKPIKDGSRWGVQVGIHFENKGMSTDATVKNYHMEINRGGETLEGVFTGRVVTKTTQWAFTAPVLATCQARNVRMKLGPYVSYLTGRSFTGYAYNGYLRVGDPTGAKVELGEETDERGDYDFSDHMRPFQFGLDLGADWNITKRFGVYADLSWSLTPVFKSDFHTVEQKLYPIYGTFGVIYHMR